MRGGLEVADVCRDGGVPLSCPIRVPIRIALPRLWSSAAKTYPTYFRHSMVGLRCALPHPTAFQIAPRS